MSLPYRAVQWNRRKLLYDIALVSGSVLYLIVFVSVSLGANWTPDYVELAAVVTRAFGTLAVLLLHVGLLIGPLSRLNSSFLVLLTNRRHLGVFTAGIALVHGLLATLLHHVGGPLNPLASILLGNGQILSLRTFPFAIFGFFALLILLLMAVTSHDFWIDYLSFSLWKRMHMLVYVAYGLVILHIAFGVLQETANPFYTVFAVLGIGAILGAHSLAAIREQRIDGGPISKDETGFVRVCRVDEIPPEKSVVVNVGEERVALFRHWRGLSAISNVCPHQGGPLGEGTMSGGCVRCPWHGAMFFPETGKAPPPGIHAVPTYNLKLSDGYVFVNPIPNPPGTAVDPVPVPGSRRKEGTTSNAPRLESGVLSPRRKADS